MKRGFFILLCGRAKELHVKSIGMRRHHMRCAFWSPSKCGEGMGGGIDEEQGGAEQGSFANGEQWKYRAFTIMLCG